jgi:hypothetical protein
MRFAALLAALPILGCWNHPGSSGAGPLPHLGVPPLVVVAPDSFSLIPLGPIQNGTFDYDWACGAEQANFTIAGLSGGWIRIAIADDDGAVVHDNLYSGGIAGAISAMTAPGGAAGLWSLRFTFQSVAAIGAIDIDADVFDDPDEITIAGSYSLDTSYEYEAGWPAGPARVVLASAISLGIVRVRIWDGEGDLVMDRTNLAIFIGAFNGDSLPGAAGTWRIRLDIDAVATAGAIAIDHP